MLVLFTDFSHADPYVGQIKARLHAAAPGVPVVDLLHEVPDYNAHAGAHLLAALAPQFPAGSVFVCVVDPGVGTPRQALVLKADGRWYVGPDNGLLSVLGGRARDVQWWRLGWRPGAASPTFHGRDIFAPLAARLANDDFPHDCLSELATPDVVFDAGDLPRAIYLDHYGNVWSGLRAANLPLTTKVRAGGREFAHAETFGEVGKGDAFWYVNSVGLLEIAVNRGNASEACELAVGARLDLVQSTPGGQRLN